MGNILSTDLLMDCDIKTCVVVVSSIAAVAVGGGVVTFVRLLRRISGSVGVAKPTEAMLREEDPAKKCALFRHFPQLAKTLAWRSLGADCPTPIHKCTVPLLGSTDKPVEILLKREDLISSDYGGNKVRTLQHQLGVCEARREAEAQLKRLASRLAAIHEP